MRLINTSTLELEDFSGQAVVPSYAILSHTWTNDEVSIDEFRRKHHDSSVRRKEGYAKIQAAYRLACSQQIAYLWIDTCTIDKTSSAELTEAINSMFRCYARAHVCYAFLADYEAPQNENFSGLKNCRWFTRGWTLQELIAPAVVEFYDRTWTLVGTKSYLSLPLESITGIREGVLLGEMPLRSIAVAERMNWATKRQTTRVEDVAYSLLGIFDVNMPLVYGEGEKAFQRLQEEIIKDTNDLSIFAWRERKLASEMFRKKERYRGILATSPKEFLGCSMIEVQPDFTLRNSECSMTNKGFKIHAELIGLPDGEYLFHLRCHDTNGEDVTIALRKMDDDVFVRSNAQHWTTLESLRDLASVEAYRFKEAKTFYILRHVDPTILPQLGADQHTAIILRHGFSEEPKLTALEERLAWISGKIDPEYLVMTPWNPLGENLQWNASAPCVGHRYNTEYTLRSRLPRHSVVPCIIWIKSSFFAQPQRLNLYLYVGMNQESEPKVHGVFSDAEPLAISAPRKSSSRAISWPLANYKNLAVAVEFQLDTKSQDSARVVFVDIALVELVRVATEVPSRWKPVSGGKEA